MTERFYSIYATWDLGDGEHTEPMESLRVVGDMSMATLLDEPARKLWRETIRATYGDAAADKAALWADEICREEFEARRRFSVRWKLFPTIRDAPNRTCWRYAGCVESSNSLD